MPRTILPLQRAVGGEGYMIASRTEGERALVRIHDEYCESVPEAWLPRPEQNRDRRLSEADR